jgi:hypothetical protein
MVVIEKNLNQMLTQEKQIKIKSSQQTIEIAQQQTIEMAQLAPAKPSHSSLSIYLSIIYVR